MAMVRAVLVGIWTTLAFAVAPAHGQFSYRLDDGFPENAIGVVEPGTWDLLWLNRFHRHPAGPRITSIEVAFGFGFGHGLEIGSPVEVLLYLDPTGGDARDATLVRDVSATIQDLTVGSFNTFPIEPIDVPGFFHVGVVLRDHPGFTFPAACDLTPPHFEGASTIGNLNGTIDVTNLSTLPPEDYTTFEAALGFSGNWLIRANGVPIPEPVHALSPLAATGMMISLHRARPRSDRNNRNPLTRAP